MLASNTTTSTPLFLNGRAAPPLENRLISVKDATFDHKSANPEALTVTPIYCREFSIDNQFDCLFNGAWQGEQFITFSYPYSSWFCLPVHQISFLVWQIFSLCCGYFHAAWPAPPFSILVPLFFHWSWHQENSSLLPTPIHDINLSIHRRFPPSVPRVSMPSDQLHSFHSFHSIECDSENTWSLVHNPYSLQLVPRLSIFTCHLIRATIFTSLVLSFHCVWHWK